MRTLSLSAGKVPGPIEYVISRGRTLSILSFVIGLCYLGALVLPEVNESTRISENALLPGLVDEHFAYQDQITLHSRHLRIEIEKGKDKVNEYLLTEMRRSGLEAFVQDFRVEMPTMNVNGSNVFGLMRAARSTANEAMLLAVPHRKETPEMMAMALAFAAYCREQPYWARSLLVVFVDEDMVGMEAWLSAYHGYRHPVIHSGFLPVHAGAIVGAAMLKGRNLRFAQIDIQYHQINGQLPNLDLVNLIVRLSEKFGIRPTVMRHPHANSWQDLITTTAKGMSIQAFSNKLGLHSLFAGYGIPAVTIEPLAGRGNVQEASARDLGRILEGLFRSLNNILERFHQSYFLYLLPHCRRFISIAYFMPALGGILLPTALREWLKLPNFVASSSILSAHLIGIGLFLLPIIFPHSLEIPWTIALATTIPFFFVFRSKSADEIQSTRFLLLLEFAVVNTCLSLLNFSLAYFIAMIGVPFLIIVTVRNRTRYDRVWRSLIGLLVHPVSIVALIAGYHNRASMIAVVEKTIVQLLQQQMLYSSFNYALLTLFLVPMWNLTMHLIMAQGDLVV